MIVASAIFWRIWLHLCYESMLYIAIWRWKYTCSVSRPAIVLCKGSSESQRFPWSNGTWCGRFSLMYWLKHDFHYPRLLSWHRHSLEIASTPNVQVKYVGALFIFGRQTQVCSIRYGRSREMRKQIIAFPGLRRNRSHYWQSCVLVLPCPNVLAFPRTMGDDGHTKSAGDSPWIRFT